jgi:hypothetical protein
MGSGDDPRGDPAAPPATSTSTKVVAAGGAGAGLLWLVAKALDPKTWTTLNTITVNIWNFGAANFWLVKAVAFGLGVPLFVLMVMWAIGEALQGAYPIERGVPPRPVLAAIALCRFPKMFMRGVGRWLGKRIEGFGFNFDDEDPPPMLCWWTNPEGKSTCQHPLALHPRAGFCMVSGCVCPGWVAKP